MVVAGIVCGLDLMNLLEFLRHSDLENPFATRSPPEMELVANPVPSWMVGLSDSAVLSAKRVLRVAVSRYCPVFEAEKSKKCEDELTAYSKSLAYLATNTTGKNHVDQCTEFLAIIRTRLQSSAHMNTADKEEVAIMSHLLSHIRPYDPVTHEEMASIFATLEDEGTSKQFSDLAKALNDYKILPCIWNDRRVQSLQADILTKKESKLATGLHARLKKCLVAATPEQSHDVCSGPGSSVFFDVRKLFLQWTKQHHCEKIQQWSKKVRDPYVRIVVIMTTPDLPDGAKIQNLAHEDKKTGKVSWKKQSSEWQLKHDQLLVDYSELKVLKAETDKKNLDEIAELRRKFEGVSSQKNKLNKSILTERLRLKSENDDLQKEKDAREVDMQRQIDVLEQSMKSQKTNHRQSNAPLMTPDIFCSSCKQNLTAEANAKNASANCDKGSQTESQDPERRIAILPKTKAIQISREFYDELSSAVMESFRCCRIHFQGKLIKGLLKKAASRPQVVCLLALAC